MPADPTAREVVALVLGHRYPRGTVDRILAALGIPPDMTAAEVRERIAREVPAGGRLVPADPTADHIEDAYDILKHSDGPEEGPWPDMWRMWWSAMLDAAPRRAGPQRFRWVEKRVYE